MSFSVVALLLVASGLQATEGAFIAKADVTYASLNDKLDSLPSSDCQFKSDMQVSISLDFPLEHESTMRVSKALNILAEEKSGTHYRIKRAEADNTGTCSSVTSDNINSRSGEQYVYSPGFFRCFLKGVWGAPTVSDVTVRTSISALKGLLIFNGCAALTRVEPWDGTQCKFRPCPAGHFTDCTEVTFYQLTAA